MWSLKSQIWRYLPAWGPARGMQMFSHKIVSESFVTPWTIASRLLCPWGFSRKECRRGLPSPSPADFLTQGLNLRPLHWQADSLPLSHEGGLRNAGNVKKTSLHRDSVLGSPTACLCLSGWCSMTHGWEEFPGETPTLRSPWAHPGTLSHSQPPSRYLPGLQFHNWGLTTRFPSPAELCLPTTKHTHKIKIGLLTSWDLSHMDPKQWRITIHFPILSIHCISLLCNFSWV